MKINVKLVSALVLMGIFGYSCSKEATSKPQYKFRKSVGDGVAAKVGPVTITDKELYAGIESELYEAEKKIFEIKMAKLKSMLLEKMMKSDPKSEGLSNDQYMDKFIAEKIKISQKQITAFIKERKIPKEHINPQVKERIKNFLVIEEKKVAVEKWLAEKIGKSGVEVFFEKAKRPTFNVVAGDSPFFGEKDAKVTIVEFSDFQCPFCAKGAVVLKEIKKKYGKKVKIAFKQYPLPFHTQARKAAMAALCANEQDSSKFWALHDKMFEDQSKLSVAALKATAKGLGLKPDQFNKCLDENKYMAQIDKEIEQGKSVSVKSTPTFFVNGQLVSGAQPLDVFSELIDQELAK